MPPVEISRPTSSFVKLGLGCLLLMALGAYVLTAGPEKFGLMLSLLVGVVTLVFFGVCGVLLLRMWTQRHIPALRIDAEGFDDHASALAAGRVPWSDVTDIALTRVSGRQMLCVGVTDPEAYLARAGGLKASAVRANMNLVGTPVCLPAQGLAMPAEEILSAMQRQFDAFRRSHG